MAEHVLITGGAGFIGSHVADQLLARGDRVRALDNLDPQVHGPERRRPAHLSAAVDLCVGYVRDPAAVRSALRGVDAVYHFAAMVGGHWANEPVPLFPYPGSPAYSARRGAPDGAAWERAHAEHLGPFERMSDIQESRPVPLGDLERGADA